MNNIWKKLPWVLAIALVVIYLLEPSTLPWILLGVVVVGGVSAAIFRFMPKRGLIGPVESCRFMPKGGTGPLLVPAADAFLPKEQSQWWYWTGHLQTEEGKRFGFEIVFFTFYNFLIMRDQLAQAAITDVDGDSFAFKAFVKTHIPDQIKNGFKLSSGKGHKITATGGDGIDHLHSEVGNYVLDIDLKSIKPVVLRYDGDAHNYVFGGYTYYYSRTRMDASGTLSINGKSHKVTGTGWFDRQYGKLYQAIIQGWQWFAIDLDDNRQIMIFDFNGEDATVETLGSITDASGHTTTLTAQDFNINILDYWTSPVSGCTYPSGWEVTVDNQTFNIHPLIKNQELSGNGDDSWVGPVYWEGACSVSGDVNGKAYVELNGYSPLCHPDTAH